jgi:hypothetical protein
MLPVAEPNIEFKTLPDGNDSFVLDADEPVVSGTVEYTEGTSSSPYFIPSSLCE